MLRLDAHRIFRVAAAFLLVAGISMPIVQHICAMSHHPLDAMSMAGTHGSEHDTGNSDCDPPTCCKEPFSESPVNRSHDDCAECLETAANPLIRVPLCMPERESSPSIAVSDLDVLRRPIESFPDAAHGYQDRVAPHVIQPSRILFSVFLL